MKEVRRLVLSHSARRGAEAGVNPAGWLEPAVKPLRCHASRVTAASLFHRHHPDTINLIRYTEFSKLDILGT